MTDREALGRRVREIWVEWATEQPDPKPSWLTGWEELDSDQREVDMRIGEAVAADERERLLGGPVSWIEPDPDQPGYNRGVTSIDATVARAVAAERERIASVTRVEVIDHSSQAKATGNTGRVWAAWDVSAELSYQDGDRTLKVFIGDIQVTAPEPEPQPGGASNG